MSGLYDGNTLVEFWKPEREYAPDEWRTAGEAAVAVLPGGAEVLAQEGWDGLMEYILGEGQFGPNRYRLSRFKRFYYLLRPILPRQLTAVVRQHYRRRQEGASALDWPIEDRYVRFLYEAFERCTGAGAALTAPDSRAGALQSEPSHRGFCPGGARFAFVLTHDVERADGQAFVRALADLDERYGFRSSFNFVPEGYPVTQALLSELRERGFEVGVHGLKHDGKLFLSRREFERRAQRINGYLQEWGAVGFRSPFTHRNAEWMQVLEIEYDSSFFDTDPYETMPGGTMSIWPFFCGRFVELPYTLVQDHTLLVTLGQRTPTLWLEKVDFIARWGGMALLNVHPDYMRDPGYLAVYEEFLRRMANKREQQEEAGNSAMGCSPYWHALPREVARWWRIRAGQADSAGALVSPSTCRSS